MAEWLFTASVWLIPLLVAVTVHEAAHAFAAFELGDSTARDRGRMTLNPIRHIDAIGTVALPALLILIRAPVVIGWAKPVPVRFDRLRYPRRDTALVAAAGPASNGLVAITCGIMLHAIPLFGDGLAAVWLSQTLINSVVINVILGMINLLPVPPLDGGRIAVSLLPPAAGRALARTQSFAIPLLLIVLVVLPFALQQMGIAFNPLSWLFDGPIDAMVRLLAILTGHGGGGGP